MSRKRKVMWESPKSLPVWAMSWEVWKEGVLYRKGTMRIPAATEQDAREGVQQVMCDLMPNLFPNAEVRLTNELMCEGK